jgi:hypothetical protein
MRARFVLAASCLLAFAGGIAVRSAYPQNPTPPRVILVDFMKVAPGNEAKYLDLERKIWKPFHQARLKGGNGRSWTLYAMRFPSGTSMDRNYATINVFDSLQDIDKYEESFGKLFPQIHPNKSVDQILAETLAAREQRTSELWVEVDRADRP